MGFFFRRVILFDLDVSSGISSGKSLRGGTGSGNCTSLDRAGWLFFLEVWRKGLRGLKGDLKGEKGDLVRIRFFLKSGELEREAQPPPRG